MNRQGEWIHHIRHDLMSNGAFDSEIKIIDTQDDDETRTDNELLDAHWSYHGHRNFIWTICISIYSKSCINDELLLLSNK